MAKVTEKLASRGGGPLFLCDFSPPRGSDIGKLDAARGLDAEFICVAYGPGRSVRLDSVVTAHLIKERLAKEVVFNVACRDMNKLAMQTHLLGAAALGLENVLVLEGDPFPETEPLQLSPSAKFTPTDLIASIKSMNEGLDFRGRKLGNPIEFCVGAGIDLGKGLDREVRLARKKVEAGVDFLVTQPVFDSDTALRFASSLGSDEVPVFFGVQVLVKDGVVFANVPRRVRDDLAKGKTGVKITVEVIDDLQGAGLDTFYLVPPIVKGGGRDYQAAQEVMSAFR